FRLRDLMHLPERCPVFLRRIVGTFCRSSAIFAEEFIAGQCGSAFLTSGVCLLSFWAGNWFNDCCSYCRCDGYFYCCGRAWLRSFFKAPVVLLHHISGGEQLLKGCLINNRPTGLAPGLWLHVGWCSLQPTASPYKLMQFIAQNCILQGLQSTH